MYGNPGFLNYLQGLGYEGEAGPDMRAYAQGLRAQGQHPRMDYRQSLGLGGLAGHFQPQGVHTQPAMGYAASFQGMGPTAPRPMGPVMQTPQFNLGGLAGLVRR